MDLSGDLFHTTYNFFLPKGLLFSLGAHLMNPEILRFDIFLFGYALLDLNQFLFYIYNDFITAILPKAICWPIVVICEKAFHALGHISLVYYYAYFYSNFWLVIICTCFFLVASLWHFFLLLFIASCVAKFMLVDVFFFFFKFVKRFLLFFFAHIWFNFYLFLSMFRGVFWIPKIHRLLFEQRKKMLKRWAWVNVLYWTLYHIYLSFLDGWALPAGGFIFHKKYFWGFPQWMYWCRVIYNREGIKRRAYALNLWSRFKMAHKEFLGVKEKKWWFFLASWHFVYISRYYCFFMLFFILFKKLRLIYFFVIFFFKFFFFKFLKYVLEFNLISGFLELFIWYYMQVRMHAREFVPFVFYDSLWAAYIYSKSYFAAYFVLIDLHYWFYRFLMFFTPTNYGFVGSENLYDQPFDVRFDKLRNFLWYRLDKNAYRTSYLSSFITWQQMAYFYFFYLINKFGEKLFILGYQKAIILCKGDTPINAAIIKAHFFYGYFLAICLAYLEGLKKQQVYIRFFYLLFKLRLLKVKLSSKKFLRALDFLRVVKFFLFLAPFIVMFFYLAKFVCFFLAVAKAPLPLARYLIYKAFLKFIALISGLLLNKLFFYYLSFFAILFFFVNYDSEKAWRKIHRALVAVVWAASFFYFYSVNLIMGLIASFIFINKKLKLWAFFIILLLLSLDLEFFCCLFLNTVAEILCYVGSTVKDIYFWVNSFTDSSVVYLTTEEFERDVNENFYDIHNYYVLEVKHYQRVVLAYMWMSYWRGEWDIIQNCIVHARADPYTWFGALLMILFTDDVPTYQDYVKVELPTFHRLPYHTFLLLYYKAVVFFILPTFEYQVLEVKHRALRDIGVILGTFISKTFFEIKWRFFVDVPYFFGLSANTGRYAGFLNFWTCEIPSRAFNFLSHYYNLALPYVYFSFNYRLKDFLIDGPLVILAHFVGLWESFSGCFNISLFKGYDSNMWVFFFAKAQKIIQFSDIYNKSFYRLHSDWLRGKSIGKIPHFDMAYHLHTNTWGEDVYDAANAYESWYFFEPDSVMPTHGRWTLLRTWDSFRLYGMNNIKRFCFKLGGHYQDGFFMPSSLFYRSVLLYLYFCFCSLFLMLYLFLMHILGLRKEGRWGFLSSSKTNVWSHIRSPLYRKRIAWVDSFSTLASVVVRDYHVPYDTSLLHVKPEEEEEEEGRLSTFRKGEWEQKFFYCFHRFFRACSKLSKYPLVLNWKKKKGWRKIRKRRAWASGALLGLKRQCRRLFSKLKYYAKVYRSRPQGYAWARPFIFREFFFKKNYKDYVSIAERNQDLFKTFLSYEMDLTYKRTFPIIKGDDFEAAMARKLQPWEWNVKRKHGGAVFERLVWGSYYQRLPFPALTKEDTYMVEENLKKIFDFFYKLDRVFFGGEGSYLFVHKDPGNDTFSYNDRRGVAFQTIEDPYELNFRVDIVLWELAFMVFGYFYYSEYVELIPAMDEEFDDFVYQYFWILSFFEHFDCLHTITTYLIGGFPYSDAYHHWDQADCRAEEHVSEGYWLLSVGVDEMFDYYFTLPDYWLREALYSLPTSGFFAYIMRVLENFIDYMFFFSANSINSYILVPYCIIKYAFVAIVIIYYIIRKFLGISIKNKKLYFYTEYSIFYLSHLKGFMRAKCKAFYSYHKKKGL